MSRGLRDGEEVSFRDRRYRVGNLGGRTGVYERGRDRVIEWYPLLKRVPKVLQHREPS